MIDLGSFAQNLHQGQLNEPLQFALQWRLPTALALQGASQQTDQALLVDALSLEVSMVADAAQQPSVQSITYRGFAQGQELLSASYHSAQAGELQVQIQQPQVHSYSIAVAAEAGAESFFKLPETAQVEAPF